MNRKLLPILICSVTIIVVGWIGISMVRDQGNLDSRPKQPSNVAIDKQLDPIVVTLPAISHEEFELSKANPSGEHQFVELLAEDTGIDLINLWNPPEFHRNLITSFLGGGAAIGDYDGDGLKDIFVARQSDAGRLYRNLGDMKFEDVTLKVGIDPEGMWGTGTTFADVNNDGRLDLYVCGFDCPNRLYINEGDRFTEQAAKYGLAFHGASVVMAFCDYDLDGDLDAYLVTNYKRSKVAAKTRVIHRPGQKPEVHPEDRENIFLTQRPDGNFIRNRAGQFDHFYQNNNGVFEEVTEASGIGLQPYMGLSATWWDYDNDGRPDLYVANDYKAPDFLYRNNGPNENGIVTFTNVIEAALPHTPWYSMGSDFGDINNDGKLDYLASDMAGTSHYRDKLSMGNMGGEDSETWFLNAPRPPQYMRNALYLNTGTEHFMEVAFLAGVAKTDWTWAVRFADLDNDGWQDVFCTNGMTRDLFNSDYRDELKRIREDHIKSGSSRPLEDIVHEFWASKEPYRLENMAFQNTGDLKFKNVGPKWGLDHLGVSTGAAIGDLDNDGDLDLVVTGFEEPVRLYRNDLATSRSIRFRLVGSRSNRNGLGARIEIKTADGQSQVQYSSPTRGFMSSSEMELHFGVGTVTEVPEVVVHWPSGIRQVLKDLETNRTWTIVEPSDGLDESMTRVDAPDPMFAPDKSLIQFVHKENPFDDFQRQPLLPNQYSQLGPGMAWGDIDADGDDDLYMGGAARFPGQLIENRGNGQFALRTMECFDLDSPSEDMGVVFLDVDADQDLDLYVVSGGVECETGADVLQDRLYLNDGTGRFEKSNWLPDMRFSGGSVSASDFDRDGKVDLFVGGRIIPGAWPEAPRSALLKNTGDGFDDVTQSVAEGLSGSGMVTSAIWSDVNSDNWPDLLVAAEWGPIRYFKNNAGMLVEETAAVGLKDRIGWYNSICGGDIDNDGDTDFVVGNFGLNSKYKASPDDPAIIYYGDFEGLGHKQIVEAKFENGVCLPRRGLSCSSHAMPMVREKLPTFHEFALADLSKIYTDEKLDEATRYEANSLESGVLLNDSTDGVVKFRFIPLQPIAQASPVFGCTLVDVNADGFLDLFVVQNFYGPQPESGYMDGGISQLLLGDGKGQFQAVAASESGLVVTRDATSLTTTDLNGDGRVDFVVGKNNQAVEAFRGLRTPDNPVIRIDDQGGGRQSIGAKIYLELPDGSTQLHEVTAGSGYLSQSSRQIFTMGKVNQIVWPEPTVETPTASESQH